MVTVYRPVLLQKNRLDFDNGKPDIFLFYHITFFKKKVALYQ